MKRVKGNIWEVNPHDAWIVVSTNVGWKKNGCNVMGRGIARQAASLIPELPADYGAFCKKHGEKLFHKNYGDFNIICLPSKPLNKAKPWLSWQSGSDIDLIRRSYKRLKKFAEKDKTRLIKTVLLGTSNGGLERDVVLKLLVGLQLPDNVYLVEEVCDVLNRTGGEGVFREDYRG